jgi:hypothetical protein
MRPIPGIHLSRQRIHQLQPLPVLMRRITETNGVGVGLPATAEHQGETTDGQQQVFENMDHNGNSTESTTFSQYSAQPPIRQARLKSKGVRRPGGEKQRGRESFLGNDPPHGKPLGRKRLPDPFRRFHQEIPGRVLTTEGEKRQRILVRRFRPGADARPGAAAFNLRKRNWEPGRLPLSTVRGITARCPLAPSGRGAVRTAGVGREAEGEGGTGWCRAAAGADPVRSVWQRRQRRCGWSRHKLRCRTSECRTADRSTGRRA